MQPCDLHPHMTPNQQKNDWKRCADLEDAEEMYLRYKLGYCICANCIQRVTWMLECTSVDPWGGSISDSSWNAWVWLDYAEEHPTQYGFHSGADYANVGEYLKYQMHKRIKPDECLPCISDDDQCAADDDDEKGDATDSSGQAALLTDSQLGDEMAYRMKKYILENWLTQVAQNPHLQSDAHERIVLRELQSMATVTQAITGTDLLSSIPFIPEMLQSLHRWLAQHNEQTRIIAPTRNPQP